MDAVFRFLGLTILLVGLVAFVIMFWFILLVAAGIVLTALLVALVLALITGKPIVVKCDDEVIGEIRRFRYIKKTDEANIPKQ